ncbi:MAG: ribosome maturation factor RimP [Clostridium sp.]|nr:ribosome maturation factor RimP [Clostridium sp.]MCM1397967.1 ribosome maturation factor RimP [Clostridium sp.]MCM1459397.1 ribosome maturation factor RimP [Bacteroides sp.]
MKKIEIEQHCTELVTPIIKEGNYELVDVEYVKEGQDYYLRVYADKAGGITIDDCVTISRALEQRLDEKDKIKDAYILEVSSPGLTRPLKKEKDFARSIGKLVDIKLYKAIDGTKELSGILEAYDNDAITIMRDDSGHTELTINRNEISMIRLAFVQQ